MLLLCARVLTKITVLLVELNNLCLPYDANIIGWLECIKQSSDLALEIFMLLLVLIPKYILTFMYEIYYKHFFSASIFILEINEEYSFSIELMSLEYISNLSIYTTLF